jgi:hypothetical protein
LDCCACLSQGSRTRFDIAIVIGGSSAIECRDGALGGRPLANVAFSAGDRTGRRLVVKAGRSAFYGSTSSTGYRIDFGVNLSLDAFDFCRAWACDTRRR